MEVTKEQIEHLQEYEKVNHAVEFLYEVSSYKTISEEISNEVEKCHNDLREFITSHPRNYDTMRIKTLENIIDELTEEFKVKDKVREVKDFKVDCGNQYYINEEGEMSLDWFTKAVCPTCGWDEEIARNKKLYKPYLSGEYECKHCHQKLKFDKEKFNR